MFDRFEAGVEEAVEEGAVVCVVEAVFAVGLPAEFGRPNVLEVLVLGSEPGVGSGRLNALLVGVLLAGFGMQCELCAEVGMLCVLAVEVVVAVAVLGFGKQNGPSGQWFGGLGMHGSGC